LDHCVTTKVKVNVKVKVKVKVKFSLEQAMKAQRGVEVKHYFLFNLGPRRGWVDNATLRTLSAGKETRLTILEEAGWAPGPVWTGEENLAPTGIRTRTVQRLANCYTTVS
jgi:hypothetical protein